LDSYFDIIGFTSPKIRTCIKIALMDILQESIRILDENCTKRGEILAFAYLKTLEK